MDDEYHRLVNQVDAVVHIAATTRFAGMPVDDIATTRHVLDFAGAAQVPVYWVSSAHVDPAHPDAWHREDDAPRSEPSPAALVTRSAELDRVDRTRRVDTPRVVVVRTSIVLDRSGFGGTRGFPRIHHVVEALRDGRGAGFSVNPQWLLDFIPADLVADAVARLVEHRVTNGDVWLTMGERALTIGQIVNILAEYSGYAGTAGQAVTALRSNRSENRDRSPEGRFTTETDRNRHRSMTRLVTTYVRRLWHEQPLETSLGDRFANSLGELGALGVPELPDPREVLRAVVRSGSQTVVRDEDTTMMDGVASAAVA